MINWSMVMSFLSWFRIATLPLPETFSVSVFIGGFCLFGFVETFKKIQDAGFSIQDKDPDVSLWNLSSSIHRFSDHTFVLEN